MYFFVICDRCIVFDSDPRGIEDFFGNKYRLSVYGCPWAWSLIPLGGRKMGTIEYAREMISKHYANKPVMPSRISLQFCIFPDGALEILSSDESMEETLEREHALMDKFKNPLA